MSHRMGKEGSPGEVPGACGLAVTGSQKIPGGSREPQRGATTPSGKPWNLASTTLQVVLRIECSELEDALAFAGMSAADVWQ